MSGRTAEIPSHRNSPQLEPAGSWALRQNQGRLAGSEYHSLGVPLIVRLRHRHDREITKPRIFDQKVRDLERLAFLKNGFMGNASLCSSCFERCNKVLRTSPALGGFSGDDFGQTDHRTGNEMSRQFNVDFAGECRNVSPENRCDRDRILDRGYRRRLGIAR